MTKRQIQARIRAVRKEFLDRLKQRFPVVELVGTEERPTGTVVFRVLIPDEDDLLAIADVNAERISELAADEDLHFMVMPISEKPGNRAA